MLTSAHTSIAVQILTTMQMLTLDTMYITHVDNANVDNNTSLQQRGSIQTIATGDQQQPPNKHRSHHCTDNHINTHPRATNHV